MAEEIIYEFDGFRVDPSLGTLVHNGESIPLRTKPLALLIVLLESHGESVSKDRMINRVWPDTIVTDGNFHVHLDAVRNALRDKDRDPRFILRTATGYRLVANVRKIPRTIPKQESAKQTEQPVYAPKTHYAHVFIACAIYAALYAEAIVLEVAYDFDRYRPAALKAAVLVFGWMWINSIIALLVDQRLVFRDRTVGLAASVLIFFASALIVSWFVARFLPNLPITRAAFQTYPAQAAYLKDTVYFFALALFFLILPFHFVATMERKIESGERDSALETVTGSKLAVTPRGTIYPRFWALALLLVLFGVASLIMTAHLLDHLAPGQYENLFALLVYVRGIFYFSLGLECLRWYLIALNEIRRQCLSEKTR